MLLVSVPHSATIFFQQTIKPDAIAHVNAANFTTMLADADLVVCALRQPERVWRSWWNRREGLNEDRSGPGRDWWHAWECLATYADRVDFWLPVDHEQKVKRLGRLMKHTGDYYKAEWHRRPNEAQRYRGPEPLIDFSGIYQIPIIGELYG